MIGDPSGRSTERRMMSVETIEENAAGIRDSISRMFDVGDSGSDSEAVVVNNWDFYKNMSAVQLVRDVGR
jgi:tyrosyl-tRNA synthetase